MPPQTRTTSQVCHPEWSKVKSRDPRTRLLRRFFDSACGFAQNDRIRDNYKSTLGRVASPDATANTHNRPKSVIPSGAKRNRGILAPIRCEDSSTSLRTTEQGRWFPICPVSIILRSWAGQTARYRRHFPQSHCQPCRRQTARRSYPHVPSGTLPPAAACPHPS